jgi:hypothetical protein
MRRRELLARLASAAVLPSPARAQQPVPVIGYFSVGSPETDNIPERLVAFRRGLNEGGYIEGQNVAIEYAWAQGEYDRLPALAADLVRRRMSVIVTQNPPTAAAAKAATDCDRPRSAGQSKQSGYRTRHNKSASLGSLTRAASACCTSEHCERDQSRLREPCRAARQGASRQQRSALGQPACANHRAGRSIRAARDLCLSIVPCCRWVDELWGRSC